MAHINANVQSLPAAKVDAAQPFNRFMRNTRRKMSKKFSFVALINKSDATGGLAEELCRIGRIEKFYRRFGQEDQTGLPIKGAGCFKIRTSRGFQQLLPLGSKPWRQRKWRKSRRGQHKAIDEKKEESRRRQPPSQRRLCPARPHLPVRKIQEQANTPAQDTRCSSSAEARSASKG